MPILYLFSLQNLNCYPNEINIAFISDPVQPDLEKLNEGEITGYFNEYGLKKEIITYKQVVPFLKDNFDKIMMKYNKNSKISVEKENTDFYCIIDRQKFIICNIPEENGYMTFDNVGIYT